MPLPRLQTPDAALGRLQTLWKAALDRVVDLPLTRGVQLTRVELQSGLNVVNHRLGRRPQGYIITRMTGAGATLYDTQTDNPRPELTLLLNASAAATVDLWIY